MKKLILISILVPALVFSQNTKTEKVMNDVGTAVGVAAGVIGLFKKDKSKTDNKANNKTDNKAQNKTTAITNSDGTFPVNAKPEDIVASVYKCTYKKLEQYNNGTYCVWKPTTADFNTLNQNNKDDERYYKREEAPDLILATQVDTIMEFKQNGVSNIVIATASWDNPMDCFACGAYTGITRFQTTDGNTMKLISNNKIMIQSGAYGRPVNISILQIDDENVFYKMINEGSHQGESFYNGSLYDLNGNYVMDSDEELKIDKANKIIKSIYYDDNGKKKIRTYQYGNGTITEIKQPAVKKTTTTKKKK